MKFLMVLLVLIQVLVPWRCASRMSTTQHIQMCRLCLRSSLDKAGRDRRLLLGQGSTAGARGAELPRSQGQLARLLLSSISNHAISYMSRAFSHCSTEFIFQFVCSQGSL